MAEKKEKKVETKNDVCEMHKAQWREFRKTQLAEAINSNDPDTAKQAKNIADLLKSYQEGERKAFGFTETETSEPLEVAWLQS